MVDGAERIVQNCGGRLRKGTTRFSQLRASLLDSFFLGDLPHPAKLQRYSSELGVALIVGVLEEPRRGLQCAGGNREEDRGTEAELGFGGGAGLLIVGVRRWC
jgi:hypothetical protein